MIYRKLLEKDGEDKYLLKVCEELAELQQALLHYKDGKCSVTKVYDELADMDIQIPKIKKYLEVKTGLDSQVIEFNIGSFYKKKYHKLKEKLSL